MDLIMVSMFTLVVVSTKHEWSNNAPYFVVIGMGGLLG